MPVIAVNVAAGVFEQIRQLVERGLYTSPEQFLEIAAFNQLALERGTRPEELVAQGGHRQPSAADRGAPVKADAKAAIQRARGHYDGARPGRIRRRRGQSRTVSEAEGAEVLRKLSLSSCRDVEATTIRATPRPAAERLWGQVNRLFPLKFTCRWIAAVTAKKKSWERYEAISDRLAEDAATFGSLLEQADLAAKRKREDVLSIGLPRRANLASKDRFLSQFVARTTRAAEIYPGAICQYALAEFDGDRLALTDRGLELAQLESPLLDGEFDRAVTTLSDQERAFFTRQVLEFVSGELRDFRTVLSAVLAGRATPEDLAGAVRPSFPQEWSEVVLRTHVSGIVARLAEVALIRRRWEGRNVKYEATPMTSTVLAE